MNPDYDPYYKYFKKKYRYHLDDIYFNNKYKTHLNDLKDCKFDELIKEYERDYIHDTWGSSYDSYDSEEECTTPYEKAKARCIPKCPFSIGALVSWKHGETPKRPVGIVVEASDSESRAQIMWGGSAEIQSVATEDIQICR